MFLGGLRKAVKQALDAEGIKIPFPVPREIIQDETHKRRTGGTRRMTVFQVGDVIRLKKPHPCGGYEWKILRIGADFRLECLTCGHTVMLPRSEVERRLKPWYLPVVPMNAVNHKYFLETACKNKNVVL